MDEYRARPYEHGGNKQIVSYYGNSIPSLPTSSNSHDMRSYSASFSQTQIDYTNYNKEKVTNGSSSSKTWGFKDPEFQRKKRVATYKVYTVEGRVKGSFRKSFRWLKEKYSQVVYGW